jgi:Flp pilus assembly protein TadG
MKWLLEKNKKNRQNERGQAAIEFIVVVVVIFFFLLFYLSLSLLLVTSEYIDYATFMAARTYKSGFSTKEYQQKYANDIFNSYTSKVQGIARNMQLSFVDPQNGDEQTAGVVSTYQMDIFYLPPVFIKTGPLPISRINLSSEAHLGRDPSYQDCQNFFQQFSQRFGLGIEGTTLMQQMDDNAC